MPSLVSFFNLTIRQQKPAPQFLRVFRTWPTDPPSSHQYITTASQSNTGTQAMSPMQRWEAENLQQSYYTGVAEYRRSSWTAGKTTRQGQKGVDAGQRNWSLVGDGQSDRFWN